MQGEIPTILCVSFGVEDGNTYTGTLNGEVLIWKENKLTKVVKCHKGPVYAICPYENGFFTGGKEGALKVWDREFRATQSIPMGAVVLKSINYQSGRVLVGTGKSDIFEVELNVDGNNKVKTIKWNDVDIFR
jgi:hypothetical protein